MFFQKKKKYDLIFGIGEACSCSSTLRSANLQVRSYPFDWLFGSTFIDRVKILVNNFENLIRLEDIVCTGNNGIPHHLCDIYTNTANGLGFNHDFLSGCNPADEIDEVVEKYRRRGERLIKSAESAKRILAVWIDSPGSNWKKKNDDDFIEGIKILQQRFPDAKVDLLVIEWEIGREYKNKTYRRLNEFIEKYSFDYQFHHKKKQVADFVVDEKMLHKILKSYELNLTLKEKIENYFFNKDVPPFIKWLLEFIAAAV